MGERRATVRSRTFLGGRILFNKRSSTMDCTLRNMGEGGARLSLDAGASLPDRFELEVPHLQRIFLARVTWRSRDAMGVAFDDENRGKVVPLDMVLRLRKLEAEKAALERRVAQLGAGE